MNIYLRKVAILFFVIILASESNAQKHYASYALLDAGLTISLADIKRYNFAPTTQGVNELQYGTGLGTTFFINENIGLNTGVRFYAIAGIDPELGMSFQGQAWAPSASLSLAFNSVFEDNLASPWNRRFKLFVKMGYGHLFYQNEMSLLENFDDEEIPPSFYETGNSKAGYSFFPLEVNFMFKLNKTNSEYFPQAKNRLYLVLSGTYAFADTDDLDSFSGRDFSSDAFVYFSVGLAFFMGR
ncbi:MAG: hypothetical protein ACQESX_09155 [Bacteroidota bacterium]